MAAFVSVTGRVGAEGGFSLSLLGRRLGGSQRSGDGTTAATPGRGWRLGGGRHGEA
jgi:hypothetical protein